jgi:hypothetical protein
MPSPTLLPLRPPAPPATGRPPVVTVLRVLPVRRPDLHDFHNGRLGA